MNQSEAVSKKVQAAVAGIPSLGLRTLALFGSALTDEFVDGRSDYNFLMVRDDWDRAGVDAVAGAVQPLRNLRVATPLLVTPRFLERALDTFPLEILSMRAAYRVVSGEDLLAQAAPERRHVRLQCEREIRAKALLLRRAYIETRERPEMAQTVLRRARPAVVAIVRGMLFAQGGPWTAQGAALRNACVTAFGLPEAEWNQLHALRNPETAISGEEARTQLLGLLDRLEAWAVEVDRWADDVV